MEIGEDGEARTMTWRPETPEDLEKARRFYDSARGVGPDAPERRRLRPGAPVRRTSEELRFISAILARPDSDRPYLDYADWLEEEGDAYGAYIRACINQNNTSMTSSPEIWLEHDRTREALLEKHGEKWIKPLTDLGLQPEVIGIRNLNFWFKHRGTIQEMEIDRPGILPENAARFFGGAPLVRRLRLNDESCDVGRIARVPQMAQIEEIESFDAAPPHFMEMCRSPHLAKLRRLDLLFDSTAEPLGEEGGQALAAARWLTGLRRLKMSYAKMGDRGIPCFVSVPAAARLEYLELPNDGGTGEGLAAVLSSSHLSGLQTLIWNGNKCGKDAFALCHAAPCRDTLRELGLGACVEDGDGVAVAESLAAASFARLERFDFNGNRLDGGGLTALLAAPWLAGLRTLNLSKTQLGDAELESLAQTDFRRLEHLQIDYNVFRDAGVSALCRGLSWPALKKLDLMADEDQPPPGVDAAQALAASSRFPNLAELDLRGFTLGTAGAEALARSSRLNSLTSLKVTASLVSSDGGGMLLNRFGESILDVS